MNRARDRRSLSESVAANSRTASPFRGSASFESSTTILMMNCNHFNFGMTRRDYLWRFALGLREAALAIAGLKVRANLG